MNAELVHLDSRQTLPAMPGEVDVLAAFLSGRSAPMSVLRKL
jgi:hypothetical protein